MTFNKYFPDRIEPAADGTLRLRRARVLRYFWIVSTLMLITGYVLAALALTGRL